MKIIFLAPFGIRPKGTVIARMLPLAVELQKRGHEVVIVAPPYTNPEDSGVEEVVRGIRIVNVRLPTGGKVRSACPLAWRMFRRTMAEKPDLIHLFKPKGYGGLAAMLLLFLRMSGFRVPPLFVDSDDWEGKGGMNDMLSYSPLEKQLYAFQEQWLSRHAAGMTVASHELERLTRELGVPAEQILYLPNGVEETTSGNGAEVRRKLEIRPDTPVLLLYTRYFEFSQERLYRLFAGVFKHVPGVRFLVVGKGRNSEEELLTTAARENGFEDALILAGWVEPLEIPHYLAAADVAIYPLDDTLVNRAKCPAKLTEIVLAGIPVVADRIGQAPEYLYDCDELCDPADESGMVDRVSALLMNREKAALSGQQGRRYIAEHFAWKNLAAGLELFYNR